MTEAAHQGFPLWQVLLGLAGLLAALGVVVAVWPGLPHRRRWLGLWAGLATLAAAAWLVNVVRLLTEFS